MNLQALASTSPSSWRVCHFTTWAFQRAEPAEQTLLSVGRRFQLKRKDSKRREGRKPNHVHTIRLNLDDHHPLLGQFEENDLTD